MSKWETKFAVSRKYKERYWRLKLANRTGFVRQQQRNGRWVWWVSNGYGKKLHTGAGKRTECMEQAEAICRALDALEQ